MPKTVASLQLSLVDLALGGELLVCSTRPADPGVMNDFTQGS